MADRETMNVSLSAEQKAFVKALVETGRYASDSEVVREGLRLLDERERQRRLEELLLEGLNSGPGIVFDDAGRERFRREMRESIEKAARLRNKSA